MYNSGRGAQFLAKLDFGTTKFLASQCRCTITIYLVVKNIAHIVVDQRAVTL